MKKSNYTKFLLTLLISFALMYTVMYLNVYDISHIYFSATRFYMTVMMVTIMAVLMILMMPMMYQDKSKNKWFIGVSLALFMLAFAGVHNQTGIGDVKYMKGMIPHHSIAILTSKNADIKDPRVRKLADEIIAAQEREITEMKSLIDSLQRIN